jgi:high-affinity Fe2+/Pb2+ permease
MRKLSDNKHIKTLEKLQKQQAEQLSSDEKAALDDAIKHLKQRRMYWVVRIILILREFLLS